MTSRTKLIIKNTRFDCLIGVHKKEQKTKQEILVDVVLFCDVAESFSTDKLSDTVNYSDVNKTIGDIVADNRHYLIESLADRISTAILRKFKVHKVLCRIKKPGAIKNADYAAVEIVRYANGHSGNVG